MALSGSTVWEVRTTGSDSNGGGFVSGASGTDYSQQDAAQFSGTDLTVDGTTNTKVTSLSHSFVAADVGNLIQITAGTGFTAGFYQILSVSSGAATLDRSPAAVGTSGGTWALGGSLASLGKVASAAASTNKCWIKGGTYNTGSSIDTGSTWSYYDIEGYQTTRGDLRSSALSSAASRPILKATAAITVLSLRNNGESFVRNIEIDGNSGTGSNGFVTSNFAGNSTVYFDNCIAHNLSGSGFGTDFVGGYYDRCYSYSNATGFALAAVTSCKLYACEARNNTGNGFDKALGSLAFCLARNNAGNGFQCYGGAGCGTFRNCVAYGNTGNGFINNDFSNHIMVIWNSISYGNGAFGFGNYDTTNNKMLRFCCAAGGNTSGNTGGTASSSLIDILGNISLTGNPFIDATNGNFSLNATAGAGALCRAAGFSVIFPSFATISFADIGGAQHRDVGGSSVALSRIFGGF